ncbi:MAG: ABC transporter ATP-binding protein [Dehalococcoidia bacterium]|nr:ABC transporter ATP-binding protein [Dehalococcoidia bacterium]
MPDHPLHLDLVSKSFGEGANVVNAVRDASFDVRTGEIVAIVGPSGSGKSTLLSMVGCLLTPTAGQLTILGEDVTRLSQSARSAFRLRHIGFVFQSFNLLPALSARENIEIALNLAGTSGRRARERSSDLLEMLELSARWQMRPSNMSGGEQQRLAIGRALANRPDVILADEPTASLDSRAGRRVMGLMRSAVERGEAKSLVVVTHDTRILDLCHRVLEMEDGQVRERG